MIKDQKGLKLHLRTTSRKSQTTPPAPVSPVSCRMHRLLRASSSSSIYIPIPSTIHKTICKVNLNQHTSGTTTTESLNCCPDSRPSFLMRIAGRAHARLCLSSPIPLAYTRFDGKLCTSRYSILLLIPPLLPIINMCL